MTNRPTAARACAGNTKRTAPSTTRATRTLRSPLLPRGENLHDHPESVKAIASSRVQGRVSRPRSAPSRRREGRELGALEERRVRTAGRSASSRPSLHRPRAPRPVREAGPPPERRTTCHGLGSRAAIAASANAVAPAALVTECDVPHTRTTVWQSTWWDDPAEPTAYPASTAPSARSSRPPSSTPRASSPAPRRAAIEATASTRRRREGVHRRGPPRVIAAAPPSGPARRAPARAGGSAEGPRSRERAGARATSPPQTHAPHLASRAAASALAVSITPTPIRPSPTRSINAAARSGTWPEEGHASALHAEPGMSLSAQAPSSARRRPARRGAAATGCRLAVAPDSVIVRAPPRRPPGGLRPEATRVTLSPSVSAPTATATTGTP